MSACILILRSSSIQGGSLTRVQNSGKGRLLKYESKLDHNAGSKMQSKRYRKRAITNNTTPIITALRVVRLRKTSGKVARLRKIPSENFEVLLVK